MRNFIYFRKALCMLLTIIFFVSLNSCSYHLKWTYPSNDATLLRPYDKPKLPYKVAVLPFKERRPDSNNYSTVFFGYIPLVPYGWKKYERPDSAREFNSVERYEFNMAEDTAKAAAYSLRESKIFKDVFFTPGKEKENADYFLEGEVNKTLYTGKIFFYCLSYSGPLLWVLGLPAGTNKNEVGISLSLKKQDTEDTIWQYSFDKEWSNIGGLYYNWGKDVKGFTIAMQEGMNDAINALNEDISKIFKK